MITEKELDELYKQQLEKRRMYQAGINYISIRQIVDQILRHISEENNGKLVDHFIIILDATYTSGCYWHAETKPVLEMQVYKMESQDQEYFEKLLSKYFNIEKISEFELKLTLREN